MSKCRSKCPSIKKVFQKCLVHIWMSVSKWPRLQKNWCNIHKFDQMFFFHTWPILKDFRQLKKNLKKIFVIHWSNSQGFLSLDYLISSLWLVLLILKSEANFLVRIVIASVSKVFGTCWTFKGSLPSMDSLVGLK